MLGLQLEPRRFGFWCLCSNHYSTLLPVMLLLISNFYLRPLCLFPSSYVMSCPIFLNFNIMWVFFYGLFFFFFWHCNALKNMNMQNNRKKIKQKEIWKLAIAPLEFSESSRPWWQARTERQWRETNSDWDGDVKLEAREGRLEFVCVDSHKAFLAVCHLKCNLQCLLFLHQLYFWIT